MFRCEDVPQEKMTQLVPYSQTTGNKAIPWFWVETWRAPDSALPRVQARRFYSEFMMAILRVAAGLCASLVILGPCEVDGYRPNFSMSGALV